MILYSSVSDLASGKANTIHTISQIWGYQSAGIKCVSLLLMSKFQFKSRQRILKDFGVSLDRDTWIVYYPFVRGVLVVNAIISLIQYLLYIKEVEVIHSRNFYFVKLLYWLNVQKNICWEIHNTGDRYSGFLNPFLAQCSLRNVICISTAMRNYFCRSLPNSLHFRLTVLPDAALPARLFDSSDVPQLPLRSQSFNIGYFGTITSDRGLEIISKISERLPSVQFYLYGSCSISTININESIKICGAISYRHSRTLMPYFDAMIMPYTSKTRVYGEVETTADVMSPMKMFDYGASNGLIISTDLGVIREILDDSTAVFCNENDINDWVSKILLLTRDKTYRYKLRSNALKLISEKYRWDSRAVRIYSLGR